MRLNPVYLVDPPPRPGTMTTRRAMLLACAGTLFGAAAGGACGYAAGSANRKATDVAPEKPADETLAWLREMASERTPLEKLVERAIDFASLARKYPDDEQTQTGILRLADAALTDRIGDRRRLIAGMLAQYIEQSSSPHLVTQKPIAARLRSIR